MIKNYSLIFHDDELTVTAYCIITKKPYSVTVPKSNFVSYLHGTLVQDAFPTLSKEDREFLISGISPEGWVKTFGENDEEGQNGNL